MEKSAREWEGGLGRGRPCEGAIVAEVLGSG